MHWSGVQWPPAADGLCEPLAVATASWLEREEERASAWAARAGHWQLRPCCARQEMGSLALLGITCPQ